MAEARAAGKRGSRAAGAARAPESTPAGRVRIRDPQWTREKILRIATEEFAALGYDGARIDGIVARCGISKNLLYHYYSGKEDLFLRVMERAYAAMRARQNDVSMLGHDPVADMRALVIHMVEHFAEQPEFIALLATENIHKARHIRQSTVIRGMYNPLKATMQRVLREGQVRGVFRPDVDWVDLYISISGMASYFVSNRYTLSYVLGVDLSRPGRIARRIEHVPEMVLAYLRARPGTTARRKPARGRRAS
jgi:TetR/AcrR family transcriptional regulator